MTQTMNAQENDPLNQFQNQPNVQPPQGYDSKAQALLGYPPQQGGFDYPKIG